MALSVNVIWEVEPGASDTLNSAAFDPGQTAGMFTDGAATSATGAAPVFTSASYNFVAGDVGAWVYVASGTNWTAGWYKIASVAANAATLNATAGQACLKGPPPTPTTATGCATTASPTGATWTIDYSQQLAAQFAYTDLASAGTGLTVSSAAKPFAKQQVGNSIVITGGTNFNTGRYVIASVAAGVATVQGAGNITTGAGASGTGGQGGALASPGQLGAVMLVSQAACIKSGTTYSITSASTNVSGGCFSSAVGGLVILGYGSVRGDFGTRPLLQASGISTFTLFLLNTSSDNSCLMNISVDGASLTSSRGIQANCNNALVYKCLASNCTNFALVGLNNGCHFDSCEATGCSTSTGAISAPNCYACESHGNTITGFAGGAVAFYTSCLSYNNSGATSDGFAPASGAVLTNCVAYGNGRDGVRSVSVVNIINFIAEANGGIGINSASQLVRPLVAFVYNNTGGNTSLPTGNGRFATGIITGTASAFVNAAGGNFALNNNVGGGALCRAAGGPGIFPSGNTTSYLDIGPAEHQDPPVFSAVMVGQSVGRSANY